MLVGPVPIPVKNHLSGLAGRHHLEVVHALLEEAVLSERQREVALAVALEDRTLADIARELGIKSADARHHWKLAWPKIMDAALRLGVAS